MIFSYIQLFIVNYGGIIRFIFRLILHADFLS